jgi:hypothetical protein
MKKVFLPIYQVNLQTFCGIKSVKTVKNIRILSDFGKIGGTRERPG